MSNYSQKLRADAPAKRPPNSVNSKKPITLEHVWSLLSDMNTKVNASCDCVKDINVKLAGLESSVGGLKTSVDAIASDVSRAKNDNDESLASEVNSLRDRVGRLERRGSSDFRLPDFDLVKESRDRLSKENNVIVFNVADSASEDASATVGLVNEIFEDLSRSPAAAVYRAKRLGSPGDRPRPILVQFHSPAGVHAVLRAKSRIRDSPRWKHVSISMDMTLVQRDRMKSLRCQLKAKRDAGHAGWFIKYVAGVPKLLQNNWHRSTSQRSEFKTPPPVAYFLLLADNDKRRFADGTAICGRNSAADSEYDFIDSSHCL